ncbi:unnamed protein product [Bursaphelenchus okinawaensis]|uniref:Expansin-like EG45 domain-containing protein n=1 Tax=Bursaphelenchus okinawaensis TaxID=465554 RepID=A0A811K8H5_9BILA|nr:unnamed protein product [Bursaphelenchus okinawaensis]CAG9096058.1 unnamed protein product [Bursaphelenchus okinawaensis]
MNAFYLSVVLASLVVADNISSQLNQPISNGVLTVSGATGEGACGLDIASCSAGAPSSLFTPGASWVASDLPDGRYILDDPVCQGVCVQVEYEGVTGVFPVDNQCGGCADDQINLSTDAFAYIQPADDTSGLINGATITYVFCNTTTVSSCGSSSSASSETTLASNTASSAATTVAASSAASAAASSAAASSATSAAASSVTTAAAEATTTAAAATTTEEVSC